VNVFVIGLFGCYGTCNSQHKAYKNQKINQQTAKSSHLMNPFG
jgi:hypothetical protein